MRPEKYKILHLEDVESDAELVARALRKNHLLFDHLVIDTEDQFLEALGNFSPDVILCDHSLPAFNSFAALRIIKSRQLSIPFIVITATMSEEVAMTVVREGADDYILKDRLNRLPFVVINAIDKYRYEKDRKRLIDEAHQKEATAKDQLQKLSNKLLLATKAAGIGTWEFDAINSTFTADDILFDIYGIESDQFDGTIAMWLSFIHYDDKEYVANEFQRGLNEVPNLEFEFRIVRRDGQIRWIKAISIGQVDDTGKIFRIVGTNQDITATKLSELAIRESEEKYRSFFENSMDGILITVTNGQIISANPAACAMFQMTEAEICAAGRNGLVDLSDARLLQGLKTRETAGKAKGEITFFRKDGSRFPGEITTSVYKRAEGEERTSMIIRDVTDRKKAEESLLSTSVELKKALTEVEKIMDFSLDIICTIDEEGRFVNVSSAAKLTLGYETDELKGKAYMDYVFFPDKEITQQVAGSIMAGQSVTMFENRYVKKDGTVVPVLWSARWDDDQKLMFCIAKDATEKKRMEAAFDLEKQRLQELFLHAPASVGVLKGPEHVFEMANDLYLQLTKRKDIIGKTVREVFPELENQGFFKLLNRVYATGIPFVTKEHLVQIDKKGDGTLSDLYLNFVYHPYKNAENKVEGIFTFVVDVTEQVKARKDIEESEKRFRKLIENLPEALYTCDADGKIQMYNKAAVELWGREPIIGKDLWCGSHKMYNVDGTPLAPANSPMARTILLKRESLPCELIIEHEDGERRYARANPILIFDNNNKLTGAVNMLVDITHIKIVEEKLRSSNERYQIVTKATKDGIWDWNLVTNEIYWNKSYERISGYRNTNQKLVEDQWFDKIHPDDKERVRNGLTSVINSGGAFWEDEFRYLKANGETAIVFDRASIMYDNSGKPVRFVGAMEDITERKKIETEREFLIEHLVKSNNDLKQFTYITSHNFRAPLSNLIGLLSLVDHHTLTKANKEIIEMFETSTQQLNKTINDLIQILIIKNNMDVNIVKNNIDEAVSDVCELLMQEIKETETTVVRNLAVQEIILNKSYLQSILINLVSNAIKYRSPDHKLVIEISTEQLQNGEILMVIKDNGSGIDMRRHQDRIFGLYQRFHSNIDGAGLGLYMVKTQVMALGGKIEVKSEEEKGTSFYITFKSNKNLLKF